MISQKILVIEDDDEIRFCVRTLLEFEGLSVDCVGNGLEALAYLAANPLPRLILLDMVMPKMDGWGFAREFYALYGRSAPIVVMTAASDAAKRARDVEAVGFISKPFSVDELRGAIKEHALAFPQD
jgi:CheY-like chemotaxis protein